MKAVKMAKGLIAFMVIALNVFGLSSHSYSLHRKKFVNSRVFAVYSILLIMAFAFIYARDIWNDLVTHQLDWKSAVKLYSYMSIVASLNNYIIAFIVSNKLVKYLNSVQFFDTIEYLEVTTSSAKSTAWLVVLKVMFFPFVIEMTLLVRQLHNEPERNPLWTIYHLLPTVISNILPNCFFSSLVISKSIMHALNSRLLEIVKEVKLLQSDLQMRLQKSYYRMQRFCDLADKMDMLAQRYTMICEGTTKYIELMAIPLIGSLLCQLFGITAGFFTQYLAIADTLIKEEPYDTFDALTNSIFLIISLSEIILLANICNGNKMAARETGLILQRIILSHADIRFKQSVESFSLLVFVTKYKIEPMGLLEVNASLLIDVLSAVTSFLLILIQSDLTLRFSLKDPLN